MIFSDKAVVEVGFPSAIMGFGSFSTSSEPFSENTRSSSCPRCLHYLDVFVRDYPFRQLPSFFLRPCIFFSLFIVFSVSKADLSVAVIAVLV